MSKVITTKRIRVTSRGRYPFKHGVILGPERFFHKEEVATIKELLSTYPKIVIEEHVKENNNIVLLNAGNYSTDNYRPPVNMEGNSEESDDNAEEIPEDEEDAQAEINPEEPAEDGNGVVVDNTTVGNDNVVPELPVETPEDEEEDDNKENNSETNATVEENQDQDQATEVNKAADTSQQQKKNKNKNKNKGNNENQNNQQQQQGSSVEVTPKEA